MGAGQGQGVVPHGGGAGVIDADRQGFQESQEGADGGGGDPSPDTSNTMAPPPRLSAGVVIAGRYRVTHSRRGQPGSARR